MDAKFICLEEPAFQELIEQVVSRIKEKNNIKEDKWLSGEEVMKKLRITSRTTLQNLRDTDSFKYAKLSDKHILYDSKSIDDYLEKKAQRPF